MKKRLLTVSALAIALSLHAGLALSAADPTPVTKNAQTQAQDQIYGSQLMTQQERIEFRAKMQAAKTVEEQEQVRNEHHKAMQEARCISGNCPARPTCCRWTRYGTGQWHGVGWWYGPRWWYGNRGRRMGSRRRRNGGWRAEKSMIPAMISTGTF